MRFLVLYFNLFIFIQLSFGQSDSSLSEICKNSKNTNDITSQKYLFGSKWRLIGLLDNSCKIQRMGPKEGPFLMTVISIDKDTFHSYTYDYPDSQFCVNYKIEIVTPNNGPSYFDYIFKSSFWGDSRLRLKIIHITDNTLIIEQCEAKPKKNKKYKYKKQSKMVYRKI